MSVFLRQGIVYLVQGTTYLIEKATNKWYVYMYGWSTDTTNTIATNGTDIWFGGGKLITGTTVKPIFVNINNTLSNVNVKDTSTQAAYIGKYYSKGDIHGSSLIDSTGADFTGQLTFNSANELFSLTTCAGTGNTIAIYDFDGVSRVSNIIGNGTILVKYDTDGNAKWRANVFQGGTPSIPYVLTADSSNVFCGFTKANTSNASIYNSNDSLFCNTVSTIDAGNNIYICKYYSNGNVHWVLSGGSPNADTIRQIAADKSDGSLYIVSSQAGTNDVRYYLNSNPSPLFTTTAQRGGVLKIDRNANFVYVGGVTSASLPSASGVCVTQTGSVYHSGTTFNAAATVLNTDGTTSSVGTIPAGDSFIVKRRSDGSPIWRSYQDLNNSSWLCADSDDNVYTIINRGNLDCTVFDSLVNPSIVFTILTTATASPLIIKRLSNGYPDWYLYIDSTTAIPTQSYPNSIVCDSENNLLFTFIKPATGTSNVIIRNNDTILDNILLSGSQNQVPYVLKIKSNGVFYTQSVNRFVDQIKFRIYWDSTGNDTIHDSVCDSEDNVYISGYCGASSSVRNLALGSNMVIPTGANGILTKFDKNGNHLFTRIVGRAANNAFRTVTVDKNDNSVYVGGFYKSTSNILDQAGTVLQNLKVPTSTVTLYETGVLTKFLSNGDPIFSMTLESTTNNVGVFGATCDQKSNVYMCGYYTGTPTLYDYNGNTITTLPTSVSSVIFTLKFDSSGSYQYARIIDASSAEGSTSKISTDSKSNIYTGGYYSGSSVLIKDGSGNTIFTLPNSVGGSTAVMCKFTEDGTFQYARLLNGSGNEVVNSISIDSQDNVFMSGYYTGDTILTDQNNNVLGSLQGLGSGTAYTLKFNEAGTFQFGLLIDSTGNEDCYKNHVDRRGNIYMGGYYNSTSSIVRYVSSTYQVSNIGTIAASSLNDGYMCKFDSEGNYLYARMFYSGSNNERVWSISTDSDNNVYMGGEIDAAYIRNESGQMIDNLPNPSGTGAIMVKFNPDGNQV